MTSMAAAPDDITHAINRMRNVATSVQIDRARIRACALGIIRVVGFKAFAAGLQTDLQTIAQEAKDEGHDLGDWIS